MSNPELENEDEDQFEGEGQYEDEGQYGYEDQHEYEDEEGFEKRDVQKLLLKSFMVVVFCYTLFMTGMSIILFTVFYEFAEAATLPENEFARELAENSDKLFQRGRYLPFVALSSAFCFGLGFLVVWLAPFSKMVHSVVLVLLVAATMFVFATGKNTPAELQTVAMIMVAAGPIALVIAARMAMGGTSPTDGTLPTVGDT